MADWEPVRSHRNEKKRARRIEKQKDRRYWNDLRIQCPHIMMPARAKKLSSLLNVDGLESAFRKESWIEHQKYGWCFVRILKPGDETVIDIDHTIKPLDNGYDDYILFKKL